MDYLCSVAFHMEGTILPFGGYCLWGCGDCNSVSDIEVRRRFLLSDMDAESAVYVLTNLLDWYAALKDRMTDAERAMFQPVLETTNRILTNLTNP